MKKIIIAIHGLSNKPPNHTLAAQWKLSIQQGLKSQGWPWRRVPIKMVYWADLFYPVPDLQSHHEIDAIRRFEPMPNRDDGEVRKERKRWLDWLEKDLEWMFLKAPKPNPFEAVSDIITRRLYHEFYTYFSKRPKKSAESDINQITRERLKTMLRKYRKKQILLLSHSMGTIIAYDVLCALPEDVRVHTWITAGSPLGQAIVMNKLAKRRKNDKKRASRFHRTDSGKPVFTTPECITHRWMNFSDLEDKIALNYGLKEEFLPNAQGIRAEDIIVRNDFEVEGKSNHHKSYGYLRTPEIARVFHEFLGQSVLDRLFSFKDLFSRNKI